MLRARQAPASALQSLPSRMKYARPLFSADAGARRALAEFLGRTYDEGWANLRDEER